MPDVKTIQEQVQDRLGELEEQIEHLSAEFEQLKRVAAMLENTNGSVAASTPAKRAPAARASRSTSTPATRGRTRAGGNRAAQALEYIGAQPGVTALELAKAMGIKRNYLYRVLPALEKEGRITKQGKGYHPARVGADSAA
ncbi:MAG: hypothetical protein QOF77_1114 [Solirubrobacteraceae bacterium]|jgi:predicted HTH transcriptional regulator|nr:hypothetical protein [Solirubrobacteraceae bacterium]